MFWTWHHLHLDTGAAVTQTKVSSSDSPGHQVYLTSFISPPSYPVSIKVTRVMLAALDTLSLFTAAVAALVARLVSDAADG